MKFRRTALAFRPHAFVSVLMLGAAGVAGCGSVSRQAASSDRDGVATSTLPFVLTTSDVAAATPDGYIVVRNGMESSSSVTTANSAAIFDVGTQLWRSLPDVPSEPPLFSPQLVVADGVPVVVGIPCRDEVADDDDLTCSPGGLRAFYLADDSWQAAPSPLSGDADAEHYSVGAIQSLAVFRSAHRFLAFDVSKHAWESRPLPDGLVGGTCTAGSEIAVLTAQYASGARAEDGPGVSTSDRRYSAPEVTRVDPLDGWSTKAFSLPSLLPSPSAFGLTCGSGSALVWSGANQTMAELDLITGKGGALDVPTGGSVPWTNSVKTPHGLLMWDTVGSRAVAYDEQQHSLAAVASPAAVALVINGPGDTVLQISMPDAGHEIAASVTPLKAFSQ